MDGFNFQKESGAAPFFSGQSFASASPVFFTMAFPPPPLLRPYVQPINGFFHVFPPQQVLKLFGTPSLSNVQDEAAACPNDHPLEPMKNFWIRWQSWSVKHVLSTGAKNRKRKYIFGQVKDPVEFTCITIYYCIYKYKYEYIYIYVYTISRTQRYSVYIKEREYWTL